MTLSPQIITEIIGIVIAVSISAVAIILTLGKLRAEFEESKRNIIKIEEENTTLREYIMSYPAAINLQEHLNDGPIMRERIAKIEVRTERLPIIEEKLDDLIKSRC